MMQGFKKRLLIQIGIALGIIILFAVFIIILNIDINKREAQIIDFKQKLALRTQSIELLSNSNNSLSSIEPLMQNLSTILPSQDQLIAFPEELSKLAKSYGVSIGFNWKKGGVASTKSTPGTILFDLSVGGEFDDIIGFLRTLESHRYFIEIGSIEMVRTERTPDIFSFKTSGTIYIN
jgi:Tfp pilus assembly protein PilO